MKTINYKLIDKYITDNFVDSDDINVIVNNFNLLDDFFSSENYIPSSNCLIKLIKNNTKYLHSLEVIFNKYEKNIVSGNSSKLFKSNSLVLSIDSYCALFGIEVSYDKFISEFDYSSVVFSDSARYYVLETQNYPLLTVKEEKELTTRIANGEKELISDLVKHNLMLVVSVALLYNTKKLGFLDLVQEGNIGLIEAAKKFNPNMGYKFSTYAVTAIKRHIIKAIHDYDRSIRIPDYMHANIIRYKTLVHDMTDELGYHPSVKEISERMNISPRQVDLLEISSMEISSLNTLIYVDQTEEMIDSIAAPIEDDNDEVYVGEYFDYDKLFSSLTERERKIIELRFGFYGLNEATLDDVGRVFGIIREGVRQTEGRALKKMRLAKETEEFEECMPNPELVHKNIMQYKKENLPRRIRYRSFDYVKKDPIDYKKNLKMLKSLSRMCNLGNISLIEYVVISWFLGLSSRRCLTIEEMAEIMKKSEVEVKKIIINVFDKLKKMNTNLYSSAESKYAKIKLKNN